MRFIEARKRRVRNRNGKSSRSANKRNVAVDANDRKIDVRGRSDASFEKGITSSEDLEASSGDSYRGKIAWNDPSKYAFNARLDMNSDIIENIVSDIQPIRIFEQDRQSTSEDFYEDFEGDRYDCLYTYLSSVQLYGVLRRVSYAYHGIWIHRKKINL